MAEKEIKIGFPETKMEALEFFLRENDTTVEKVLKEHLDKTCLLYTSDAADEL